ncbi:MAG: hypothetical protein KA712_06090 [Myxococcales bacterium]|nr:hypothetical protein [Myxococcales bacterium]
MRDLLRLWFGFTLRVDRRRYLASGVGLMALKYGLEVALVYAGAQRLWTPLSFFNPLLARFETLPPLLMVALVASSLPFAWVGASMTARRSVDAGMSPLLSLLFFLPVINLAIILFLALAPSREVDADLVESPAQQPRSGIRAALLSAAVTVVLVALSTLSFNSYSMGLFLGTPFVTGAVAGWMFNRGRARDVSSTIGVMTLALLFSAGGLLVSALDGVICIGMALPLAWVPALLGALLGRQAARRGLGLAGPLTAWAVLLTGLTALSGFGTPPLTETRVTSSITIEASAEETWSKVVAFTEITEAPGWLFRAGVAYPVRARLLGEGVGSVRRCEFSTGAFVEPITVWSPPTHLAFDVREQPPTMTELSFYEHVLAPHLTSTFRSRRGEFRLYPEGPRRTRVEGTTWFTLDMEPAPYWHLMARGLVHAIHLRVLEHIKRDAEGAAS